MLVYICRPEPKRFRTPSPSSSSSLPSEEDDPPAPLPEKLPRSPKTAKRVHRASPKNLAAPPPLPMAIRPKSQDTIRAGKIDISVRDFDLCVKSHQTLPGITLILNLFQPAIR